MQTRHGKTIKVITLGCSKNIVDSEKLLKQLIDNGFRLLSEQNQARASIVLINTCGFIQDAKEESIDAILQSVYEKKKGNVGKVVVMGCLAQRYRDELIREIPEIDGIFGVNQSSDILHNLGGHFRDELMGKRILAPPSHYAYLKLSEGCSHSCSFCAIPMIRGKHVSRPENEILTEAENLVRSGVRELILIAQDLTYYGIDLYHRRSLPSLIRKMAEIEGLEWIRLHYTYPAGFPLELLSTVKQLPTVCNYIDVPVQHISDRILKSMNRGITSCQTMDLLDTIRKEIPTAAIRTTLIAGYPGETDQEFKELIHFIEQYRFDRLGIFTYSHEENTPAYRLRDDVPAEVKKQRADEIMHIQENISYELNYRKLHKVFKVVVDREDPDYFVGRTEFDSPEIDHEVLIEKDRSLILPGNFYPVQVTDVESFDIFGKIV